MKFKMLSIGIVLAMVLATAAHAGDTCGDPLIVTLYAGQTIDVGTVAVTNDDTNLYVTYNTTGGWYIAETHLAVASSLDSIPQTGSGNPIPGQFPYKGTHEGNTEEVTYAIDRQLYPDGMMLYIAVHAVVVKVTEDGLLHYASYVVMASQGTQADGDPITDPARTDPQAIVGPPDGDFYSLGFGHGMIIFMFEQPVYNCAGDDLFFYEVTSGDVPLEWAVVYAFAGGDFHFSGFVANINPGGMFAVNLPDDVVSAEALVLIDISVPDMFDALPDEDGLDLDAVLTCRLYEQEETAWGDGLPFAGANWATYFTYVMQPCVVE